MSRTPHTLTNTDLAFLLCTMTLATTSPHSHSHSQSQSQFPKVTLSFETNYGLLLSLEPDDGSITIRLRNPPDLDPFDSATPIQSQQQLFAFPSAPVSHGHGSIDGVLSSSPLRGAFGMMTMTAGTGGASITPARSTLPPSTTSRLQPVSTTMTRTPSQRSSTQQKDMANKADISNMNSSNMRIRYYIRPSGLEVNNSSHMYYTASASASASSSRGTQPHPQPQPSHDPTSNLKPPHEPGAASNKQLTSKLHRVKLSHLQSLYHTHLPSSTGTSSSRKSTPTSWFDAYLDWIDRLDDAVSRQRSQSSQPPHTPRAIRAPMQKTSEPPRQTSGTMMYNGGPFTDSGERSLWLVEGMLLASWLSLQEGVEGVEYFPLHMHMSAETESESGMEGYVYRLENLQGMEKGGNVNNAGVMMKRLLMEVVRAGDME